jgi:small subunit ribosomal protein S2
MRNYIFTERNGIHIVDLQKTIAQLQIAHNVIKETVRNGGVLLFVGTKRQAQNAVVEEANRCGMPYVANRWLGGMLTNFTTIQKSIQRLNRLERMEVDGSYDLMTKKEVIHLQREKEKLLKNIGGIKELDSLPDMIFIIDTKKEAIAVAEAIRMKIPIVAIVDTNCNPEGIHLPIPGNDDAIRAINLFCRLVADAVVEGQSEAGKVEISEEGEIMSLEEEERARKAREEAPDEEEEGYIAAESEDVLSDNDVQEKVSSPAESGDQPTDQAVSAVQPDGTAGEEREEGPPPAAQELPEDQPEQAGSTADASTQEPGEEREEEPQEAGQEPETREST